MVKNNISSKKKIYIDLTNFSETSFITGIQRVVKEVIVGISQDDSFELVFMIYKNRDGFFHVLNSDSLINSLKLNKKEIVEDSNVNKIAIDKLEKDSIFFDIDGVWSSTIPRNQLYPYLKKNNIKIINMIYDIIPIKFPMYCDNVTVFNFMVYIGAVLKYADYVIVNTNATKEDIKKLCIKLGLDNPECFVVPLGSDFKIQDKKNNIREKVKKIAEAGTYILTVGTIEPRKNHNYIVDALDSGLSTNVIFVGRKGWNIDRLIKRIKGHKLYNKRLFWISDATDDEVNYLYQNSFYVVFPSFDEGYGLPIIESLLRGVPVVASDIPVLKEVGQDFVDYLDNTNSIELVEYIKNMESDDLIYNNHKLKIKGYIPFTWEESTKKVIECINNVV